MRIFTNTFQKRLDRTAHLRETLFIELCCPIHRLSRASNAFRLLVSIDASDYGNLFYVVVGTRECSGGILSMSEEAATW